MSCLTTLPVCTVTRLFPDWLTENPTMARATKTPRTIKRTFFFVFMKAFQNSPQRSKVHLKIYTPMRPGRFQDFGVSHVAVVLVSRLLIISRLASKEPAIL